MFPLLLGLVAVGSLVGAAIRRATGPSHKVEVEREKLDRLKTRQHLSLDEAEDGVVLARRFGDKKSEVRFAMLVQKLRKKRVLV